MNRIEQSIELAKTYLRIAQENKVKNAKELSQLTYKLRESGEDIPYLAVATTDQDFVPTPTAKQKNWKWLREQTFGEGFIRFYVTIMHEFGFEIWVILLGEKNEETQQRNRTKLFHQVYISK